MVIATFGWAGCSYPGKQAGNVRFSGFLGQDYDKLQKGVPEQPLYSYINPGADTARQEFTALKKSMQPARNLHQSRSVLWTVLTATTGWDTHSTRPTG